MLRHPPGVLSPVTKDDLCSGSLLFAVTVVLAFAFAAPAVRANESLADYRRPGVMIDVGGHRLHLYCTGAGAPVVILDAGVGATYIDWIHVQPQVARTNRVCSYDRAGYGWSEAGPQPRTTETIVAELERLLITALLAPPYVLVGHSFGGLNVQHFAARNRRNVAGLVLVDAVHPEQFERFAAAGIDIPSPSSRRFKLGGKTQITKNYPPHQAELAYRLVGNNTALSTLYNEVRNMPQSARQTRAAGELPASPLAVVRRWRARDRGDITFDRAESVWADLQQALAERTPRGQLLQATTHDHQVHLTQPGIVVRAIRLVLDAAAPG